MLASCRRCVAVLYWAEDQLSWLFTYPLFPAQILFMLLAAWGAIGSELGVERLFWSERWSVQFGCGLAVGMLFGVVLYVWYLLDRPQRAVAWAARRGGWTLFPSGDAAIRSVGAYLLWALPLLLLVLVGGKLAAVLVQWKQSEDFRIQEYLASRHYLLYGVAGYLATLLLAEVLFVIDEQLGLRQAIARSAVFRSFGGVGRGRIPPEDVTLHATSVYLVVVGLVFLAVAVWQLARLNATDPGEVVTSPVLLVCLVFIILSLLHGFWSFHVHLGSLTLVSLLLALAAWNSATVFPAAAYKLQIPGLERYYAASQRLKLEQITSDGWSSGGQERLARPLLKEEEVVAALARRWEQQHGRRPKLLVVAVSGGGVRAAAWTGRVLEGLEEAWPEGPDGFRQQVRLLAGASGGMLAAALYVADWERDWPDRGRPEPTEEDRRLGLGLYAGVLAEEALLPTFQTAVMRDFSRNLLVPPWRAVDYDRGRSLEDKWMLNARRRGFGPPGQTLTELQELRAAGRRLSPFNRTFADLYAAEAAGRRPSLIFSPMLVEDSRRLLISNLDLAPLAQLERRGPGGEPVPARLAYSRSGLELFKLFPEAMETLEVGTAARLSATFPVITPAVSLPTVPPRHVVDAGYFDNYGVDIVAVWLALHRDVYLRYCDGVAVIEIRAFPMQQSGLDPGQHAAGTPEAAGLIADALTTISTPLQAVLRARGNVSYHRNNELLAIVDQFYDEKKPGFLRRFLFELNTEAALSWYIAPDEKLRIREAWDDPAIQSQVQALAQWLAERR